METILMTGSPSKKGWWHTYTTQASILTNADTVAVETHGYSSVGIASMNEILGHIEVIAHYIRESSIGFLVGGLVPQSVSASICFSVML